MGLLDITKKCQAFRLMSAASRRPDISTTIASEAKDSILFPPGKDARLYGRRDACRYVRFRLLTSAAAKNGLRSHFESSVSWLFATSDSDRGLPFKE